MNNKYLKSLPAIDSANSKGSSHLDSEIDSEIEVQIQSQTFEDDTGLLSTAQRQERARSVLKEVFQMKELTYQVQEALTIICSEGQKYLTSEQYKKLLKEIRHSAEILGDLDLTLIMTANFKEILHVSNESVDAIVEIAVAKFDEEQFGACLALFTFLTVLTPESADYWFRAAIAAQHNQDDDLALKNYAIAAQLAPELAEAHIFAAQCYLNKGLSPEAAEEYEEAKKILSESHDTGPWKDLLIDVETLIKAA